MADDESQMINTDAKPTYQASMRLKSGPTVRITVDDGQVLMDICDDHGRTVSGWMTDDEAGEVASMCRAAERRCF
jgi:hypothetical protein